MNSLHPGWGGPLEGVGPEMATSETHLHKITNVHVFDTALGLNDFDEGKTSHWT